MRVVPDHPGAHMPHESLNHSQWNAELNHVRNEGVPQVMEAQSRESGRLRQRMPCRVPRLLMLVGIIPALAFDDDHELETDLTGP